MNFFSINIWILKIMLFHSHPCFWCSNCFKSIQCPIPKLSEIVYFTCQDIHSPHPYHLLSESLRALDRQQPPLRIKFTAPTFWCLNLMNEYLIFFSTTDIFLFLQNKPDNLQSGSWPPLNSGSLISNFSTHKRHCCPSLSRISTFLSGTNNSLPNRQD